MHDRVRRLEDNGTILGYAATVAPAALGLGVCALISVHQTDSAERDDVAFVIMVRAPDLEALEHVLAELWHIPGVARTRTTVVLTARWEGRAAGVGTRPGRTLVDRTVRERT